MSRQHTTPIHLPGSGEASPLVPLGMGSGPQAVSEADLQALIHAHPTALPIAEIDAIFSGAVPICTELNTPAGPIDNFMVTPSGLPVLVECKLWRNPEGRREVVGQILDYAKELSRWTSADVQREVRRRVKVSGNPLLDLVRAADPAVDEVAFNDALTANLRRGRFLLLIVGDGIREGVEAISEYLQIHAGLHFSLGLVELPIYSLADGSRLVAPRVLARTALITREVVALPEGLTLKADDEPEEGDHDPDRESSSTERQQFWAEFLSSLRLDDPEQAMPKASKQGYVVFMLPSPEGSSWLTVYRNFREGRVGLTLSSSKNSPGDYAMNRIVQDWAEVQPLLGGGVRLIDLRGRVHPNESFDAGSLTDAGNRARAFCWLAERVNTFVNVLRPRVRSAVSDYLAERRE